MAPERKAGGGATPSGAGGRRSGSGRGATGRDGATGRQPGQGRSGAPGATRSGTTEGAAGSTGGSGARGAPGGSGARGAPGGRRQAHRLRLEVGGHGVELHCDTCGLVVTHLAGPEVRSAVETAHRAHLGELVWASGWMAVCSCGWRSEKLSQERAQDALDTHEAEFLRRAAGRR